MSLRVVVLGHQSTALAAQIQRLPATLDLLVQAGGEDAASARTALAAPLPDIAVLTASLREENSFAFVRRLAPSSRPTALIFVSAREEDAVQAFELQATDFVPAPVSAERLHDAVVRARQQVLQAALLRTADQLQRLIGEASGGTTGDLSTWLSGREAEEAGRRSAGGSRARTLVGAGVTGTFVATAPWRGATAEPVLDLTQDDGGIGSDARPLRVLVREGRRTRFVPLADVDWFEADGNYIVVHAAAERYRTRGTITAIETALDPRQFVRIHRRMVVNMDRVREMSPLPGGDGLLMLGNGSTLRLSRTYRSRVR